MADAGGLAQQPLGIARRAPLPDPRRLAHGPAPAAGRPAAMPTAEADREPERDPFEPRAERSRSPRYDVAGGRQFSRELRAALARGRRRQIDAAGSAEAICEQSPWCARPCASRPRDGRLYVFMPPLDPPGALPGPGRGCIEADRRRTDMPVIIEGYEPPRDTALQKLLVTPDPGVIEVNVHPAASWDELVRNTTAPLRGGPPAPGWAPRSSCSTAATPAPAAATTSPWAAPPRPTARCCAGPTCCAAWSPTGSTTRRCPICSRACSSAPPARPRGSTRAATRRSTSWRSPSSRCPQGEVPQPWLVDRLLRNLLVDVTGNTHRAEFCIDKLYSPDTRHRAPGPGGVPRLRDAAPRAHGLVQMLLLRTLVARFWNKPYRQAAGALGHRAARPLHAAPLRLAGHRGRGHATCAAPATRSSWNGSRPSWSSASRTTGDSQLDDIDLELRWAIEPWHVLGEEIGSRAPPAIVDSSVERLQVKVTGLTDGRHVVACNGRRVPLRTTGRQGEYVAGVRYRAWQPPSALHPTIAVQSPLVFDIIDTWNGRSLGGCTYHVSHPGGPQLRHLPGQCLRGRVPPHQPFLGARAYAGHGPGAPGRKRAAEFPHPRQPRTMAPPPEEPTGEYPCTLDLRRQPD